MQNHAGTMWELVLVEQTLFSITMPNCLLKDVVSV